MMASGRNRGYSNISDYGYDQENVSDSRPILQINSHQYNEDQRPLGDDHKSRHQLDFRDVNYQPRWYWRLTAVLSQWMVLGGFLSFPSTYDSTADTTLRVSAVVLSAFIVALLTGGFCLSVLLWFAVPSPRFRQDAVVIPLTCVSAFSLLATLLSIAGSNRYDLSRATFPVSLALSTISTLIYASLFVATNLKPKKLPSSDRSQLLQPPTSAPTHSISPTPWTFSQPQSRAHSIRSDHDSMHTAVAVSTLHNEPNYYSNFQANMYPTSLQHNTLRSSDADEDDVVVKNLSNLLAKAAVSPVDDLRKSTYQLQWPVDGAGEQDQDDEINPITGRRRQPTFNADGSINYPRKKQRQERRKDQGRIDVDFEGGESATRVSQSGPEPLGDADKQDITGGAVFVPRGNLPTASDSTIQSQSQSRRLSREERRQEIELGTLPRP